MPNQEIIVRKNSAIRHPIRLTIASTLLLGGIVTSAFFGMAFLSILSIGLSLALFLTSLPFQRSLSQSEIALQIENQENEKLKELKRYIGKTQYLENVENMGEIATHHLTQICERYESSKKLLLVKFNPNEITYSRYYSATQQTFLSILDNLNLAATILNTLNAVNAQDIEKSLKNSKEPSEIASLQERKLLREKQVQKLRELFALNEKAITEFDHLTSSLSEIQTNKGGSSSSLEASIVELTELANRAKKYNVSS